eukprot:scaffold5675_cov151-Amphora_coffeaeformis.AAC.1
MSTTRSSSRKRPRAEEATTNENNDCWTCPFCTLQNSVRRRRCGACEARRPVAAEQGTHKDATTNTSLEASPILATTDNSSDTTLPLEKSTEIKRPSKRSKRKAPVAAWLVNRRRRRETSESSRSENSAKDSPSCASLQMIKIRLNISPDKNENTATVSFQDHTSQLEALVPDDFVRRLPSPIKDVPVESNETSRLSAPLAQPLEHDRLDDDSDSSCTVNNTVEARVTTTEATELTTPNHTKQMQDAVRNEVMECTSLDMTENNSCESEVTTRASNGLEAFAAVSCDAVVVKVRLRRNVSMDLFEEGTDEETENLLEALIPRGFIMRLQQQSSKSLLLPNISGPIQSPPTSPCQGTIVTSHPDRCNHTDVLVDDVHEHHPSRDMSAILPTLDACGSGDLRAPEIAPSRSIQNAGTSYASQNDGTTHMAESEVVMPSVLNISPSKPSSQGISHACHRSGEESLDAFHQEKGPVNWSLSETPKVLMDDGGGKCDDDKSQQIHAGSGETTGSCIENLQCLVENLSKDASGCPQGTVESNHPRSFWGESPEHGQLSSKACMESDIVIQENKDPPSDQQSQCNQTAVSSREAKQNVSESTVEADLTEACFLPEVSSKKIECKLNEQFVTNTRWDHLDHETKACGSPSLGPTSQTVETTEHHEASQTDAKPNESSTATSLQTEASESQSREMCGKFCSEAAAKQNDPVANGEVEQCDGENDTARGEHNEDISSEPRFGTTPREAKGVREHDTPSTPSWQPITQNDRTMAAGQFVYTPASQSQEYSCSHGTLSQEYSWAGQSPTQSQAVNVSSPFPYAGTDVEHLPGRMNLSKVEEQDNLDDAPAKETVVDTLLDTPLRKDEPEPSCENVSGVNIDSPLVSRGHVDKIIPLVTRGAAANDDNSNANTSILLNRSCHDGGRPYAAPGMDSMPSALEFHYKRLGKTRQFETSFERAEQEQCEPQPPRVSFQTAGKKKEIVLDEVALSRAQALFLESPRQTMTVTNDEKQYRSRMKIPQSEIRKAPLRFSFHTAGKGDAIEASEENMQRAHSLLLEGPSTPGPVDRSNERTSEFKTPANAFHWQGLPRFLFQTAGKGRVIEAQEEDLKKVRQLLSQPNSTIVRPVAGGGPRTVSVLKAPRDVSRRRISDESVLPDDVNECRKSSAGQGKGRTAQVLSPVGAYFQTAGKQKNIGIDDVALSRARNLLADIPNTVDGPLRMDRNMKTPGTDYRVARPPRVSFQTAGKRQIIEAPEEEMQRARNLLAGSTFSIETTAFNRHIASSNFMKNPRARPSGVAPSRLSFQTAGKREIIEVPEEEVGLARDLLDS